MGTYSKILSAVAVIASLFSGFCQNAYPFTAHGDADTSASSQCCSSINESNDTFPFELLPDVNASIEAAAVHGGDYSARTLRVLQFDALRIRDLTFHFSVREKNLFSSSPDQLDHEFTYIGIKYKTFSGNINFFWDHTCNNPSRKLPKDKKSGIHWNELGIGYETTGMTPSHKNDGIEFGPGFAWVNRINWRASLSKIWMRTENDYEWMGKLRIRYDIIRNGRHVFYVQAGLDSICDDRGFGHNYLIEIGDRFCWQGGDCLTPFFSYEKFHDWYAPDNGQEFILAGLRLEMDLLKNRAAFPGHEKETLSWNPEIRVTGGYANVFDNEKYGHISDFALNLDLLQLDSNKKLGLNAYIGILTLPDDLNPFIVKYEIGPSVDIVMPYFYLRFFHSFSSLYGVEKENVIRDYHFLGIDVRNKDTFPWQWDFRIGGYPVTKNFSYRGDIEGSVRFTFIEGNISPYIACSGRILAGNTAELGYSVEPGVKITGEAGSFSIYMRRNDDYDVFRFGNGTQKMVGIRFEF